MDWIAKDLAITATHYSTLLRMVHVCGVVAPCRSVLSCATKTIAHSLCTLCHQKVHAYQHYNTARIHIHPHLIQ